MLHFRVLGVSWGRLGGGFGRLGGSWAALGRFLGILGDLGGVFGRQGVFQLEWGERPRAGAGIPNPPGPPPRDAPRGDYRGASQPLTTTTRKKSSIPKTQDLVRKKSSIPKSQDPVEKINNFEPLIIFWGLNPNFHTDFHRSI